MKVRKGIGATDSPAKKLVRLDVFETAASLLGDRFWDGNHLGLAGHDGGDISTLAGMEVPMSQIIMVDKDESAVNDAKGRWPEATILHGELNDVLYEDIKSYAHVNFDTCGWITEQTLGIIAELATEFCEEEGLLTVWALGGREDEGPFKVIQAATAVLEPLVPEGMAPYLARILILQKGLTERLEEITPRLLKAWCYVSTDEENNKRGIPMCVGMFHLASGKGQPQPGVEAAINHPLVFLRGDVRKQLGLKAGELLRDSRDAELLLNSPGSRPAWLAHLTRGSYGDR